MAIQEAKQQHPDMLVTKAVVIRETESPTEELQHRTEVCNNSVHLKTYQIYSETKIEHNTKGLQT